jgi:predicted nucleic acid-binding protein
MSGRSFFDANILIYTDDVRYPDKRETALQLIEALGKRRLGVISIQVLQEYFNAATRKLAVAPTLARRKVVLYGRMQVMRPGVADVLAAIDIHDRYSISFWDAMIVRSALASRCVRIYTEDLQHGQIIDGCEIVNPFLQPPVT